MRLLLLGFAFLASTNCDPVQNMHYQDYFNSINLVQGSEHGAEIDLNFYQAPGAAPLGSSYTAIENYAGGQYCISTKSFLP